MSLFLKQEGERTQLQKRIAAELAEKAKKKALEPQSDRPDGVSDSAYMQNTRATSGSAWLWILGAVVVLIGLVWLVVASS